MRFVKKAGILSSVISHVKSFNRGVAQSGRVLALGARCRRFKSCYPDHFAGIAQLVEQLICNHQVVGSTPAASTILW